MKAIMISIKPQYVAKILNGEKTLEIRKTIPKCDLPIDVYIYCTKRKPLIAKNVYCLNNKVVARFTLNICEYIYHDFSKPKVEFETDTMKCEEMLKKSCLTRQEMEDYIGLKNGYAWHIDNLEIFDRPKELSEFVPYSIKQDHYKPFPTCDFRLTRAPQSWCYIEVNNE